MALAGRSRYAPSMPATRHFGVLPVVIMLFLCASWALQQIAVKVALPETGPMLQGALRSTGASALIAVYVFSRGRALELRRAVLLPGLLCGLMFGTEFIMLYQSLVWTDAARVVMFLYTAPFFVAAGGHFWFPGERLDWKAISGIALAFAGVVIALEPPQAAGESAWLGDLLALGAGAIWGLTTLVIRGTELRTAPPSQVLLYQLGVSALMFWLAVPVTGESPAAPTGALTIASLLYQTLWVATISYVIWFVMITRYSPTKLSVVTFVTPLIGAALGVLLLGEALGTDLALAVCAVAVGILLVNLPRRPAATPRGTA